MKDQNEKKAEVAAKAALVGRLVAGYDLTADEDTRWAQVEAMAKAEGIKTASVVALLSRSGHYKPRVYKPKVADGDGNVVTKESLVVRAAAALGITAEQAESLGKVTKALLVRVTEALERCKRELDTIE